MKKLVAGIDGVDPDAGDSVRSDCCATREQFSGYQQSGLGPASEGPLRAKKRATHKPASSSRILTRKQTGGRPGVCAVSGALGAAK